MPSAMCRGCSRAGPRRLAIPISTPPTADLRVRRKGAGEDWLAADSGRNMKNSVSLPWAATCRRRKDSGRILRAQNSSAAQHPERNTWSAAHRASLAWVGRSHSKRSGAGCQARQAAIWGICGGCSSTMGCCAGSLASAACSRRSSPAPGPAVSNSVRLPCGHPPPGSSADSAGCPVSTQCPACRTSWEPRQSAGCRESGRSRFGSVAEAGVGMASAGLILYGCTVTQFRAHVQRR